jgi:hypothetical protein
VTELRVSVRAICGDARSRLEPYLLGAHFDMEATACNPRQRESRQGTWGSEVTHWSNQLLLRGVRTSDPTRWPRSASGVCIFFFD